MRLTQFFLPTIKEEPADAVVASHKLMIRSGMIRQLTSGVYSYLPLGLLVFKKIEKVLREEMNAISGQEFFLPALSPNELWHQTGRLEDYGDTIFRIKNRELVLAPTHEEVFTSIAKSNLISYKDLPQMWYQIQTKFRNEARPRSGVLRGRQFTMKDAYSFDSSWEALDKAYADQAQAYRNIFTRCGLNFYVVTAFSGAMGGSDSEEFMVESDAGEDNIVVTENNSYCSNIEVAVSFAEKVERKNSNLEPEEFHTPDTKTIEQLAKFVKTENDWSRLAKSRLFVNGDSYVLTLVCGDDEVSETKMQNVFGQNIRPAHPEELMEISGADAGSIGPLKISNPKISVVADFRLEDADELISGANKNDYHFKNIDLKRDVPSIKYYDIRTVKDGELTADKKDKIRITKAIEVGHIFKLGTKYSEALGSTFLDEQGNSHPVIMGSYGIGVERIAAAHIEQNHDKFGIVWNGEIAPFQIQLICANTNLENIVSVADSVYNELLEKNIEVLYDDRKEISAGFKFKDADLIGTPIHVIIGEKNLKNGNVEIKIRKSGERHIISKDDLMTKLHELLNIKN